MLNSIYIGLTGLSSYSRGLQTISNNVANLNTPGFKTSTLRFGDLFYTGGEQGRMSAEGVQYGTGVNVGGSTVNFRQGDMRNTGGDLDFAIQGRGLLVLMDGANRLYARTGQFGVDAEGFVAERQLGFRLGVLGANGQLQALGIDGKRTSAPQGTTRVSFADNLSATAQQHVISGIEVYDSNGGKHTWIVRLDNTTATTPGRWAVKVENASGGVIKEGEIVFNGSLLAPDKNKVTVNLAPAGAAASVVELDFSGSVTGFSAGTFSSLRVGSKDGYGAGELTRVVLDDGQLKMEYSNGQSELAGHVALADFEDLQALEQRGDGLFEIAADAQPRLMRQGEGGLGTLRAQSLEASNVDLSSEFGQLILFQRGYQASSQVIGVANEMLQQLFELRGR